MYKYDARAKIRVTGFIASLAAALVFHSSYASAQSAAEMNAYTSGITNNVVGCATTGNCEALRRQAENGMAAETMLAPWVFRQQQANSMRQQELARNYTAEAIRLQQMANKFDNAAKQAYAAGNRYLAYKYQSQAQRYYDQARSFQR